MGSEMCIRDRQRDARSVLRCMTGTNWNLHTSCLHIQSVDCSREGESVQGSRAPASKDGSTFGKVLPAFGKVFSEHEREAEQEAGAAILWPATYSSPKPLSYINRQGLGRDFSATGTSLYGQVVSYPSIRKVGSNEVVRHWLAHLQATLFRCKQQSFIN